MDQNQKSEEKSSLKGILAVVIALLIGIVVFARDWMLSILKSLGF